jgi:hypothetical protein
MGTSLPLGFIEWASRRSSAASFRKLFRFLRVVFGRLIGLLPSPRTTFPLLIGLALPVGFSLPLGKRVSVFRHVRVNSEVMKCDCEYWVCA